MEEEGAHEFVGLAEGVHLNVEAEVEENGPILKAMAMALLPNHIVGIVVAVADGEVDVGVAIFLAGACLTMKIHITILLPVHLDLLPVGIKEMITWIEMNIQMSHQQTCLDKSKIKTDPCCPCPRLCPSLFRLEETIAHRLQHITVHNNTICLMKGIIMTIDNTKMNIMNNNLAHHHPLLHHLLNSVWIMEVITNLVMKKEPESFRPGGAHPSEVRLGDQEVQKEV